jgi:DNA-3-methyladenine glycosylase II
VTVQRGQDRQPVRVSEPAELIAARDQMADDADSLASEIALFTELMNRNGLPPLWRREASFETLVRFILEQQVSLASANAAFGRLEERVGEVLPGSVLASSDAEMRADGFSRQKTHYVRGAAALIVDGRFDPANLPSDPDAAKNQLLAIKGIGPWTASCFLLFVCGDRDIWPTGDRALYVSMANNLELDEVPSQENCDEIASEWAPWRSTAAKMLWHDYLGGRSHIAKPDSGFIEGTGKVLP